MTDIRLADESYKLRFENGRYSYPPVSSGENCDIDLISARGDFGAFQIIISSDSDYVVNIGKTQFFSQRGPVVTHLRCEVHAPFNSKMYIEGTLPVDEGAECADILLGADTCEFCGGDGAAVFVKVDIPADAVPGEYTGAVRIFESNMLGAEKKIREFAIKITVYPYTCKPLSESRFYLDLWQHPSNIARHADVPMWSEEHFEVLRGYLRSLAELGQKALTLVVSEAPWGGQGCHEEKRYPGNMYEYSIIPVTRTKTGAFVYNFEYLQRYIDIGAECGIRDEISLYGLINVWGNEAAGFCRPAPDYPDGVKIRYFDEESGGFRYMDNAADIDAYIRAIEKYFLDTKQIGRVRVAADEPADVEAFRKSLSHLKSVAPAFRYKAAMNHARFIGEFGEDVDDFVPYLACLSKEYGKIREYKQTMSGKRFLWYVCCIPEYPNTFISSDLCESYFIGALTSYLGLDGFLRWNYTVWPDSPRKDMRFRFWPAGDCNFVYPGYNGKPLLSLRYFALMRGIRLYELLEGVREAAGEEEYLSLIHNIVKGRDVCKYISVPDERDMNTYSAAPREDIFSSDYGEYKFVIRSSLEIISRKKNK